MTRHSEECSDSSSSSSDKCSSSSSDKCCSSSDRCSSLTKESCDKCNKYDRCDSCNSCNSCGDCGCKSGKTDVSCLDKSCSDDSSCSEFSDLTKADCCPDINSCDSCDDCNDCNKCGKHEKLPKHHPLADLVDSSSSSSSSSSEDKSKCRKFVFDFGCKDGHPWAQYNSGSQSIHVNGQNGPVLKLKRGYTYYFCAKSHIDGGHGLILTNSPAGGNQAERLPHSFKPCNKGCVVFHVDHKTPKYFFYQDVKNQFAGGIAMVSDE